MALRVIKKGIVRQYGKLWTRASENLKKLRSKDIKNVTGVYALYNGTMPVYIGKGKLSSQIRGHNRSRKKTPFWDHFSWFEIDGPGLDKEIESLLLKVLPFYLRSLNRIGGKFASAEKIDAPYKDEVKLCWPKGGAGKKSHRKRKSQLE